MQDHILFVRIKPNNILVSEVFIPLVLMFLSVKFPEVCKTAEVCRKTLAMMFAHFQQETAGLFYIKEINQVNNSINRLRQQGT